jgi:hypothetical protein
MELLKHLVSAHVDDMQMHADRWRASAFTLLRWELMDEWMMMTVDFVTWFNPRVSMSRLSIASRMNRAGRVRTPIEMFEAHRFG